MKKSSWTNRKVKAYYRDCGKGFEENKLQSWLWKLKALPSLVYQARRIKDTVREILKLDFKGEVLDAACGSGYVLQSLPKGTVGMEINPCHVRQAKINASHARVIQGDIEKIPYPKSTFSTVLALEIFEHVPDSQPIVAELWRVLKKGGRFVVTVPTDHFLWRWRSLASPMSMTEPQCLAFSEDSLLELFSSYGYKVCQLKKIVWGLNYLLVLEKKQE